MSNITKNLLLALTLVCVIALIVFCIQLLIINRGVEPITPGASVSGGPQSGDEDPDSEENGEDTPSNLNGDGDAGENGYLDPAQETTRQPPVGTRNEIQVTSDSTLVIYAREELFDFERGETDWFFIYTGEGVATLEIRFTLITGGIGAHAESFLNTYSGGDNAVFNGEEAIRGSSMLGYNVSIRYGGEMYEAWIHELIGQDIALAFVINYTTDEQKDALYDMLSTIDIETAVPNLGSDATAPDTTAPDTTVPDATPSDSDDE